MLDLALDKLVDPHYACLAQMEAKQVSKAQLVLFTSKAYSFSQLVEEYMNTMKGEAWHSLF